MPPDTSTPNSQSTPPETSTPQRSSPPDTSTPNSTSIPSEKPAMLRRLPTWSSWRLAQSLEPASDDSNWPSKFTSCGGPAFKPALQSMASSVALYASTRAIGTQPAGSGSGSFAPLQYLVAAGEPSVYGSEPGLSGAYHAVRYCKWIGLSGSPPSVFSFTTPLGAVE